MNNLAADIIVIGAGAGGAFATAALAEAGYSVLVIERGPWFDYEKDFPMRHADWERRPRAFRSGYFFRDPTIEFIKGTPILEEDSDLCTRNQLDILEKHERRGSFRYQRVYGVGGSTLHYQGEAHRFPPHAFRSNSEFGIGVDWPLDYAELEPYYAEAEKWLGVAGEPGNPFKAARGTFPTPGHPLSTKSQWVRRSADQLGWSLLPNTLALPSRSYDGRTPCQHSGGCVLGCPFGAKSSVDLAVMPRAQKTGRVRVLENTRVLELECANDGSISGVVYLHEGERKRATASRYVLASGAIETPRLMLASQNSFYPNGIGNHNDRVGRNLMETIYTILTVEANVPVQSWKGPPIDSRIWDFNRPDAGSGVNGFALGVSGTMSGYQGPLSYTKRIVGMGSEHKQAMRNRFGRIVDLFGIADHAPHADNRVMLSDKLDKEGVPKVAVISDYRELDRRTLRSMISRLTELAGACAPEKVMGLYSTYSNISATHVAGTCMMGKDPETSVTNPYGKVHGVPNLFITDASVLPGQGMGDSPSLTIQALALRTAEYIALHK
jgi:choline dehydrogenase-like flavoprotein